MAKNTDDFEVLWRAGRYRWWIADGATDEKLKKQIAKEGWTFAERAVAATPYSAAYALSDGGTGTLRTDDVVGGSHLLQKAWQAALVVLVTALVARVAWEVLKPLVPGLLIAVILVGIYGFMLKGRRH